MDSIVVARYNEDLSWLSSLLSSYNNTKCFIYNKGNNNIEPVIREKIHKDTVSVISLPNIGRESHTYLHHIVAYYDVMDKNGVTFFTQGSIKDHNIKPADVCNIIHEARVKGFSDSRATIHIIDGDHLPRTDFRILQYKNRTLLPNANNETFGEWFERCLHQRLPYIKKYRWIIGAIFAVRNDVVLQNSKSFYEMLLHEIPDNHDAPEVGHFFERSWYYIFRKRPFYKRSVTDVIDNDKDLQYQLPMIHVVQIDTRNINNIMKHTPMFPSLKSGEDVHTVFTNYVQRCTPVYPEYHYLTNLMNTLQTNKKSNWSYEYLCVDGIDDRHPSWIKCRELLKKRDTWKMYDIVIIMDTDAWIRDICEFEKWIEYFMTQKNKCFMFSGEAYGNKTFSLLNIEQYINGGLMIFKTGYENVYKSMEKLYDLPENEKSLNIYKSKWSYEQICLSYLLENDVVFHDSTIVIPCNKFNTPCGTVVAHCWWKEFIQTLLIHELIVEFINSSVEKTVRNEKQNKHNVPPITLSFKTANVSTYCDDDRKKESISEIQPRKRQIKRHVYHTSQRYLKSNHDNKQNKNTITHKNKNSIKIKPHMVFVNVNNNINTCR